MLQDYWEAGWLNQIDSKVYLLDIWCASDIFSILDPDFFLQNTLKNVHGIGIDVSNSRRTTQQLGSCQDQHSAVQGSHAAQQVLIQPNERTTDTTIIRSKTDIKWHHSTRSDPRVNLEAKFYFISTIWTLKYIQTDRILKARNLKFVRNDGPRWSLSSLRPIYRLNKHPLLRVNTPPGVRTMQPPPVGAGSTGFLQGKILLHILVGP